MSEQILESALIKKLDYTLRTMIAANNKELRTRIRLQKMKMTEKERTYYDLRWRDYKENIRTDLERIAEITSILSLQYNQTL